MPQAVPARERIKDAFYMLLRDTPYRKIKVSALIAAAGVNRSTFYRIFENTEDLMECVAEELQQRITVPPPFAVTNAETLERYANLLFDLARQNHAKAALLSGENGDMSVAYRLAEAVKNRLTAAKDAAGISDPGVERCLQMAGPSLAFYFITGGVAPEQDIHEPIRFEIVYDRKRSLLENVAVLLARRRNGNPFFHYDLLCAYIKLDAVNEAAYRNITVSQLLETAGIARTEFYKYYKNINDFFESFEDACLYCALYWLADFMRHGWPSETELNTFIQHNDVRVSIVKFFTHGRISTYFPRILNLTFRYTNSIAPNGLPEDTLLSFSYYVTVFAYAICSYLIGNSDYAALHKTFAYLQTVRGKFGL